MRWLLLSYLSLLSFSCCASIEFIVTNSEQALSDARQDAFSIGSALVLVVAGVVLVSLVLSVLRKA